MRVNYGYFFRVLWSGTVGGHRRRSDSYDSRKRTSYEETYTAQRMRKNPHCFTFQLEPNHADENRILDGRLGAEEEQRALHTTFSGLEARDAVLRLYDKAGALIHEKSVPRVEWDCIYWN